MKLGGFVLFSNNAATITQAIQSLHGLCDDVVAVDSGATDGSRALAEQAGARCIDFPWQGFGAARAAAIRALQGCDWVTFLDSDEYFEPASRGAMEAWKRGAATNEPVLRLRRNDWVELPDRRFIFRSNSRARLFRYDPATFTPSMLVHESAGAANAPVLTGVVVQHRFISSLDVRLEKERKYALLWAIQATTEQRRDKSPALQRLAHFVRDAVLRGAALRGGLTGAQLAWKLLSAYSYWKYRFLSEVRAGKHAHALEAFAQQRFTALFDYADAEANKA